MLSLLGLLGLIILSYATFWGFALLCERIG